MGHHVGHSYISKRTLAHFLKIALLQSHGSARGLRIALPHHHPPTTRSQGRAEAGRFQQRAFLKRPVAPDWNNMDNVLISDALSLVRTAQCQGGFFKFFYFALLYIF